MARVVVVPTRFCGVGAWCVRSNSTVFLRSRARRSEDAVFPEIGCDGVFDHKEVPLNAAPVVTRAATTSFAENGTGTGTVYTVTGTDVDAGTTLS